MALHEVLEARRDDVMRRWKAQAQGVVAPDSMPHVELINHLPEFLQEIIVALKEDAGLPSAGPSPDDSATAAGHGEQRLRLGFSLDSVVREYGTLRDAIVATARAEGTEVSSREYQIVFDSIITGIAHAVVQYTQQRDADVQRQANEHFAFIAHELSRDPLSSAAMAFQILKDQGQLPTEGRATGALKRGLERLGELIDQTLQMARVASGIELRRQWISLKALFEDAELAAIPEAESKGIELRLVIETDQRVHLDLRLVRSAVRNLLRNGVKFTPPGGVVELRGGIADGRAVIEIEDRCGGLPPGKVEEAFAPFVRLDARQSGFGLGLAIAKQAVDAHGGSIRVQNLPGKGCVFVLEFPTEVDGGSGLPGETTQR